MCDQPNNFVLPHKEIKMITKTSYYFFFHILCRLWSNHIKIGHFKFLSFEDKGCWDYFFRDKGGWILRRILTFGRGDWEGGDTWSAKNISVGARKLFHSFSFRLFGLYFWLCVALLCLIPRWNWQKELDCGVDFGNCCNDWSAWYHVSLPQSVCIIFFSPWTIYISI